MAKLVIVESPAKAKTIGKYLGKDYEVTASMGHIRDLPKSQLGIDVEHDYAPQYINIKDKSKLIKELKAKAKQADGVLLATDPDREGEAISWHLANILGLDPHEPNRVTFDEITKKGVQKGMANPRAIDEDLFNAQQARRILDRLVGYKLSPFLWRKVRRGLSAGRVQSVAVRLIDDREKEIENFKPEPYWVLTTNYRDTVFTAVLELDEEETATASQEKGANGNGSGKANDVARRGFTSEEEGRKALEQIKDAPFTITSVTKKNGTEAPPRLYDLTSLQVECNRKFSFSSDLTLQLIQSLYEKKFTTYPRVDTTFLSDDIYPKCNTILNGIAGEYAALLQPLRGAALKKSKKVFDSSKVTDHHAIIPTGVAPHGLTPDEQRVFDLVARRFIAAFYPDCKFATTTILGETADIPFKATGKQILLPGWRDVYAQEAKTAETLVKTAEEERTLPAFTKGESGPHVPDLAEKWTQPPKPYTEATLLRAMETAGRLVDDDELRDALKENGIGRPSTRAAIIQTLFKRHYIRLERKNLIATPTGVELISLIHEELLKSAELTGIWERRLRLIEKKTYDAKTFLEELKQMVAEIVHTVLADNTNRRVAETQEDKPAPKGKKGAAKEKPTKTPKTTRKIAPPTTIIPATPPAPKEGDLCPLCGKGHIIKGKTAFGCSEWKNGCTFRAPLEISS